MTQNTGKKKKWGRGILSIKIRIGNNKGLDSGTCQVTSSSIV